MNKNNNVIIKPADDHYRNVGLDIVTSLYSDSHIDPYLLTLYIVNALHQVNQQVIIADDITFTNLPTSPARWRQIARYVQGKITKFISQ